jgi:hypothetical protein
MLTTQEQIDAILAKLQQLDERLTIIQKDIIKLEDVNKRS